VLKDSIITEEKNIVANALKLMEGCMMHKQDLFGDFLKMPKIDELVMSGILYCTDENIRSNF
jgi:hypothetical protein